MWANMQTWNKQKLKLELGGVLESGKKKGGKALTLKAVIRTSSKVDTSMQCRVRKKDQCDFAGHKQYT